MKKQIVTILTTAILFTQLGCSSKGFFSTDKRELNALLNTKKAQLYSSVEIKASLIATYLNTTNKDFKDSEDDMFLISIFIDNDSTDKNNHGLYNKNYSLTVNGEKPTNVKKLDFEDDLTKSVPVRNFWSTYYLVGFKKQNDKKLKMTFKNDVYGSKDLEFSKEF